MKLLFILFLLNSFIFAQSLRTKINEGNDKYNEEQYEEALNSYQDALIDDPQSAIAYFNRGDAFYKMEKYDKAIEEYQKALSAKDINMEAKSHIIILVIHISNRINCRKALNHILLLLILNPEDKDAKYNLELARAKLKEMADKQQQQPQQDQQQQQGEQQQESGEGEKGEQENKQEQEQQQGEQQNEEQQKEQEEQQQAQQLEEEKDQMSKEDAERILEALKNDEQDNQKFVNQ